MQPTETQEDEKWKVFYEVVIQHLEPEEIGLLFMWRKCSVADKRWLMRELARRWTAAVTRKV